MVLKMQKRLLLSQGRLLDGPTSAFREGGPNEQPTLFLSANFETYKADSGGAFGFNQNNQRTAVRSKLKNLWNVSVSSRS